jgi:hypothetical protein
MGSEDQIRVEAHLNILLSRSNTAAKKSVKKSLLSLAGLWQKPKIKNIALGN